MRVTEHYEEALTDLDYAIELDPENASAYLSRGQTYYETGHYEEALRDFDYAIKLDPDHKHRSYRWKGQTLQSLGRYQEAIEAFVKAVAALPICKECWGLLTKTCEALYSRSEVPQLLRQVSIPEASTASVIVSRAKAMVDAGYYEEALTDFAQVVVINPDNVETISSRGQAYIKLKRYEEALTDFAHTIELKPQRGKFIFHRAQSYRYLGCYQDALRDFDLASKLDPELKHASQKEKGLVFHAQGKYPKAVDAFTKALIITPICNECWRLLAKTYEASYPRSEIPRLLRSVSIPDASVASVIANRALAMKAIGYYEEALADLERVITLDKALIERYCDDRGLLFSYLKQYDKAIENYEYGLQQKPNDYSDLYNIAVAMTRWKGPTEARVHIDAAYAALRPRQCTDRHGAALYGLGGLEALLGNPDRALDYLQQAILFEEGAAEWARHDIAWLDLRADPRFQALISDDSQWVAYLALKAQSQHSNITLTRQEEAISTKPTLTDSLPVRVVATSSSSMQGDIMYSPIATPLSIPIRRPDIDRLVEILAKYATGSFGEPQRFFRHLIFRTELPQRWKQEVAGVWTGDANYDADALIRWSIGKGINPENPRFTTLGSILRALLPEVGLDDAKVIAALIVVYHLYLESRLRESIAIRYQIPQVISLSTQQSDTNINKAWHGPVPNDELELQNWLKSEPDMLDVGFLIRAIQQAATVCRIELPQQGRYGTGFLVAPNLVLTNYHVLKLDGNEDLEENARNAVLRFGCVTAEEGSESEGQTFKLVASKPALRWSQTDKLDYALLQVEERITQISSIKHVQYDFQPIIGHMGMHILQHPGGEAMKLAISSNGVVRTYPDRGLVQYVTRAREGASGSPCFNENWKVVALHHAEQATAFGSVREGILFSSLYKEIKEFL